MQRHLQKCFDAIHRLEFAIKESETGNEEDAVLTTDIVAMISPEGERVPLGKGLRARGNMEDWLSRVEDAMFKTLKGRMKQGIKDLAAIGRKEFLSMHPSQVKNTFLKTRCIYLSFFVTDKLVFIINIRKLKEISY